MRSFLNFNVALLLLCFGLTIAKPTKDLPTEFPERAGTERAILPSMGDCPQSSFQYPNAIQTTNYIRMKTPVPDLNEFTVCAWIKPYYYTSSSSYYDTWFSYSNSDEQYAFSFKTNYYNAYLYLNGYVDTEALTFTTNVEHHVCFATFMNSTANSYMFVDGQLADVFHGYQGTIKGGGAFILGQMQSNLGTSFYSQNGAKGLVSNFMVWDRVLEFAEFLEIYQNKCTCPTDYVLSSETTNVEIFGGATAAYVNPCN